MAAGPGAGVGGEEGNMTLAERIIAAESVCVVAGLLLLVAVYVAVYRHGSGGGIK